MPRISNIQIDEDTLLRIEKNKEYPCQTYNELLTKMLDCFEANKQLNQHNQFLRKIQQGKMKELWDNSFDEAWDDIE